MKTSQDGELAAGGGPCARGQTSRWREPSVLALFYWQLYCASFYLYPTAKQVGKALFGYYRELATYEYVPWVEFLYDKKKPLQLMFFVIYSVGLGCYIVIVLTIFLALQWRWTAIYDMLERRKVDWLDAAWLSFFPLGLNFFIAEAASVGRSWMAFVWIVVNPIFACLLFDIEMRKMLNSSLRNKLAQVSWHHMLRTTYDSVATCLYRLFVGLSCSATSALIAMPGRTWVRVKQRLNISLFLFVTCTLLYTFVPMALGRHLIFNEFIEVSEKTKVDTGWVDNQSFIKERLSFDKFKTIEEVLDADSDMKLDGDEQLQSWVKRVSEKSPEKEFIKANKFSFKQQVLNRTFDIHNNQVLNPVNAWTLGLPFDKTQALYGYLNSWLARMWFSFTNDYSYSRWFQFAYCIYIVYFLVLFLSVRYYFNSSTAGVLVYTFSVTLVVYCGYMGYYYLVIGQIPMNPIRHFFDAVALFFLFNTSNGRKAFCSRFCLLAVCCLAVANAENFGLAMTMATALVYAARSATEREHRVADFLTALGVVAGTVVVLRYSPTISHPGARYFIDGFFSMPVRLSKIVVITSAYSAVFFMVVFRMVTRGLTNIGLIVAWSAIYSYLLLFHYFWHGNTTNAVAALPMIALAIVALWYWFTTEICGVSVGKSNSLALAVLAVTTLVSYINFFESQRSYNKIGKTHEVNLWKAKEARFVTTMPEQPFKNTFELIHKYSRGQSKIYILSKYDYYLPFFVHKYSGMLYPNLPWFIVTTDERDKALSKLKKDMPEILFVDTDIDLQGQLWTANSYFCLSSPSVFRENRYRLLRLQELKRVFDGIKTRYALAERGELISVYSRRFGRDKDNG